jgi:hypothetical protein
MTIYLETMTDDNQPDTTSRSDSEPVSGYTTENEDNTNSTDDTAFEPEAVAEPEPIEPERPIPLNARFLSTSSLLLLVCLEPSDYLSQRLYRI